MEKDWTTDVAKYAHSSDAGDLNPVAVQREILATLKRIEGLLADKPKANYETRDYTGLIGGLTPEQHASVQAYEKQLRKREETQDVQRPSATTDSGQKVKRQSGKATTQRTGTDTETR